MRKEKSGCAIRTKNAVPWKKVKMEIMSAHALYLRVRNLINQWL